MLFQSFAINYLTATSVKCGLKYCKNLRIKSILYHPREKSQKNGFKLHESGFQFKH